jgi:hypothetical protein
MRNSHYVIGTVCSRVEDCGVGFKVKEGLREEERGKGSGIRGTRLKFSHTHWGGIVSSASIDCYVLWTVKRRSLLEGR